MSKASTRYHHHGLRQQWPRRSTGTRLQQINRYRLQSSLRIRNTNGEIEVVNVTETLLQSQQSSSSMTTTIASSISNIATTTTLPVVSVLTTIPIFPLRKTVKLPTDNITLNLYETRYIQMVEEAVLNQNNNYCNHNNNNNTATGTTAATSSTWNDDNSVQDCRPSCIPLFGAIYTTDLPHIVVPPTATTISQNNPTTGNFTKDKNTYIVPILEPNMIGSVFIVTNHTTTMLQQQYGRKVIQLNATAILRFRIIKIIHTGGYDDLVTTAATSETINQKDNRELCPSKPYIVAQVQFLLPADVPVDTIFTKEMDDDRSYYDLSNNKFKSDATDTMVDDSTAALPDYLLNLMTQYGPTILSRYFNNTTSDMLLLYLETAWRKELIHFYNVSLTLSSDNKNYVVPLYQEQKERLRVLSK